MTKRFVAGISNVSIMKQLFLATIAGALIAFMWGYISWEMLSWHEMDSFSDSEQVSEVMVANADDHGIYLLPQPSEFGPDAKAITKGPFVYAIVRPDPLSSPWSMTEPLIRSFCIQLIGAFIIALTILRIRATRYISRASVGFIMGLFSGLMMTLPTWNWFELPMNHAIAYTLDPLISWTVSGMVIAAIIRPKKARRLFS